MKRMIACLWPRMSRRALPCLTQALARRLPHFHVFRTLTISITTPAEGGFMFPAAKGTSVSFSRRTPTTIFSWAKYPQRLEHGPPGISGKGRRVSTASSWPYLGEQTTAQKFGSTLCRTKRKYPYFVVQMDQFAG